MIDHAHKLPIFEQARLLDLYRSSVYYLPKPTPDADLRLMRKMGIEAIYRKANTSRRNQAHRIYSYLLLNLNIDQPNHVWATDMMYIPMRRGFVYRSAVLDWATRKVLS